MMLGRRAVLSGAAGAVGLLAAGVPAPAFAADSSRLLLPDGFQPEGVAIGPGPFGYFGSLRDGDIYRADLRTGAGQVISEGPGTPSVGMKTDATGRLFVAGGPTGDARVIDVRTGAVLASYQLASVADTFVNDVVLGPHAAWFTDSRQQVLYALPLSGGGLPAPDEVVVLPITGDLVFVDGFNANGLSWTPDRRSLLVVQSTTSKLYRVDPRTGNSVEVDLGGAELVGGDGLLLSGRTLYVAQNFPNLLAVLALSADGSRGWLVETRTDDSFDIPTTIGRFGDRLYLPNARFTTPPEPDTPYWVSVLPRH